MVIGRSLQAMADAGIPYIREALAQMQIPAEWHGSRRRDPEREVLLMETGGQYVGPGTTCDGKEEFSALLQAWLQGPHDATIGEPSSFGGKALIHIDVAGRRLHLNGDTKEPGVRRYLELVGAHGSDLPSHVANAAGKVNKVAFGDPPEPIRYFYLYADEPAASPYAL